MIHAHLVSSLGKLLLPLSNNVYPRLHLLLDLFSTGSLQVHELLVVVLRIEIRPEVLPFFVVGNPRQPLFFVRAHLGLNRFQHVLLPAPGDLFPLFGALCLGHFSLQLAFETLRHHTIAGLGPLDHVFLVEEAGALLLWGEEVLDLGHSGKDNRAA